MASIKDRVASSTTSVIKGKSAIANSIQTHLGINASSSDTFQSLADKISNSSIFIPMAYRFKDINIYKVTQNDSRNLVLKMYSSIKKLAFIRSYYHDGTQWVDKSYKFDINTRLLTELSNCKFIGGVYGYYEDLNTGNKIYCSTGSISGKDGYGGVFDFSTLTYTGLSTDAANTYSMSISRSSDNSIAFVYNYGTVIEYNYKTSTNTSFNIGDTSSVNNVRFLPDGSKDNYQSTATELYIYKYSTKTKTKISSFSLSSVSYGSVNNGSNVYENKYFKSTIFRFGGGGGYYNGCKLVDLSSGLSDIAYLCQPSVQLGNFKSNNIIAVDKSSDGILALGTDSTNSYIQIISAKPVFENLTEINVTYSIISDQENAVASIDGKTIGTIKNGSLTWESSIYTETKRINLDCSKCTRPSDRNNSGYAGHGYYYVDGDGRTLRSGDIWTSDSSLTVTPFNGSWTSVDTFSSWNTSAELSVGQKSVTMNANFVNKSFNLGSNVSGYSYKSSELYGGATNSGFTAYSGGYNSSAYLYWNTSEYGVQGCGIHFQ